MPIDDLRKLNTEYTTYAVDALNVALDQMVARADDEASGATRNLIVDTLLLLAALGLSVGGFLIVRRRVSATDPGPDRDDRPAGAPGFRGRNSAKDP